MDKKLWENNSKLSGWLKTLGLLLHKLAAIENINLEVYL